MSFDISLSGIYQDKSTTKNVKRIFFGISYISVNNYLRKNNYQNLRCLCSKLQANLTNHLTLSWRRPLSYRNQSIDLLRKLMDWFLYDNGLRHERVKNEKETWSYYFSNWIIILRDTSNFWFKKLFETRLLCLLFRQSSTASTGWNMCLKEKRGGNKTMSQIFCFVYW